MGEEGAGVISARPLRRGRWPLQDETERPEEAHSLEGGRGEQEEEMGETNGEGEGDKEEDIERVEASPGGGVDDENGEASESRHAFSERQSQVLTDCVDVD